METRVTQVFDLLDQWRHLPDYQLERRADIFFAIYLPAFLRHHLRLDISDHLIPEFPIRRDNTGFQSFKIDYVALSTDLRNVVFVELKTDRNSIRDGQDDYLEKAFTTANSECGFSSLINDVVEIARKSKQRRKYACLLKLLESHKLIELIPGWETAKTRHRSVPGESAANIKVLKCNAKIEVWYLLPPPMKDEKQKQNELRFDAFEVWLRTLNDPFANRFAQSLNRWIAEKAGSPTLRTPNS